MMTFLKNLFPNQELKVIQYTLNLNQLILCFCMFSHFSLQSTFTNQPVQIRVCD